LYVEAIFPLMIIEQKHGWGGIQSRMPIHFRIREMAKRAIEFILHLDSFQIAIEGSRFARRIDQGRAGVD